MTVVVNGTEQALDPGTSIAGLVERLAPSPRGVAVALNGEIVPRSAWGATPVDDGDRVEVLGAAQGG